MPEQVKVCDATDLEVGTRKIVKVGRVSIGVFNVGGTYYAIRNVCPHRGAELCYGEVGGTMLPSEPGEFKYGMDDLLLECPWHGLDFDLRTGVSFTEPDRYRCKVYPVTVRDGDVLIEV